MAAELTERLSCDGFAVVPGVLDERAIAALVEDLAAAGDAVGVRRRGRGVYAVRDLLRVVPATRSLARSAAVRALVEPVLGPDFLAVRGVLFDKTPRAAWKVAWHQDVTIAVRERKEVEGFGPWSVKAGIVHVQPPPCVLARMLAVRLHLDDCDETNGALKVLPGTHAGGRLGPAEIERLRRTGREVVCRAARGAAIVMRPLLLHASAAPLTPRRRRVVHLEFAADHLPGGLEWGEEERA